MFGFAPLFRIIAPIPFFELAIKTIGMHHRGQHLCVLLSAFFRWRPDIFQQLADMAGRFCHLGFKFEGSKVLIAKKRGHLLAQCQHLARRFPVVGRAAIGTPRCPGFIRPFAQIAPR